MLIYYKVLQAGYYKCEILQVFECHLNSVILFYSNKHRPYCAFVSPQRHSVYTEDSERSTEWIRKWEQFWQKQRLIEQSG